MKYFFCTRVDYPPFLKFDCCARDEEELLWRQLGSEEDGLLRLKKGVFKECDIPELENGIYPVDIKDGEVIPRDPVQLAAAATEQKEKDLRRYVTQCDKGVSQIIGEGFEFDGHRFSLSANAQLNWLRVGVDLSLGVFQEGNIPTQDNQLYRLTASQVRSFYLSFCSKVENSLLENEKFKKESATFE